MSEAPDSNTLFGIAKKWTAELEAMPIQSQGTIISLLNAALQHRKLNMDEKAHEAQVKAQTRQIEMMEKQARQAEEREALERSGLVLASR